MLKCFVIYNNFMTNNTRITIKREYYNILTKSKGYELDNGMYVENDKIVSNKVYDSIVDNIIDKIHKQIEYILNPEFRKTKLRSDKLERILKEDE